MDECELDFDSLSDDEMVLAAALIEYATLTSELPFDRFLTGLVKVAKFVRVSQFVQIERASAKQMHHAIFGRRSHLTDRQRIRVIGLAA